MSNSAADKRRIALVVPGFQYGGGVSVMASFLYSIIRESSQFHPELISLAVSAKDSNSLRLASLSSWWSAIAITEGVWQGIPYHHVGAILTEFEFQRYRPRRILTQMLNQFDLIQVVSGAPAVAFSVTKARPPVCAFVATTVYQDRYYDVLEQKYSPKMVYQRIMTYITSKLEVLALPHMAHVFAESEYTMRLLEPFVSQKKISLGVPGVDLDVFYPAQEYKRNSYILFVGRYSDPRKNLRLLLQAYDRFRKQVCSAPRLVLVGLGELTTSDADYIKANSLGNHVDTYNNVTIDKLGDLYRNAALLVLSSNEEGLGIVILEAMASGIPVISTRCGGPETAVIENETGYLTPIGNVDALAQRMEDLWANPDLREQMGKKAHKIIETRFSLRVAGDAYLQKYAEILEKRNLQS